MPTNYKHIADENVTRYGTDIDEYGPVLLSNRYSDRTHFVYELLQNAEDAIGWRLAKENGFARDVVFELENGRLQFRHFGLPFNEEHVRGICNIGKGTKRQDLSAIGKHGIGFKSVYAYTHHPEVHSGDEHFVIDSFVRPCRVKEIQTASGETKFVLPFDHPEVLPEEAYAEIADRLQKLGLRTLLFLRNIDSISWTLACGKKGQYLREAKHIVEGIERVTLLGQDGTLEEEEEQWLVFRKPVTHDGRPAGFAEVAFNLTKDEKQDEERIAAVPESPLVVFFPTEKETHFGFLIQGPYRTTPSRDNIPRDDTWNKYLVAETANVLTWAMTCLRDHKLMNVGALEALVVDLHKYDAGSQAAMFRPVAEAIVESLKTEKLIPGFRGGHLPGSAACIARTEGLRTLVSHSQLAEVAGSKAGWVTGEITYNRTPALRSFLIDFIGVKEFDGEDFVREMSDEFVSNQSDEWMTKFYAFLLNQHAIQRQYWFKSKAIIRLKTDKHVTPFGPGRTPNAYLPGSGRTEFPTVKKSLCDGDSLKFLQQIGLRPPDPVDDVIRNVLPKYEEEQIDVSDDEYDDDIFRILEAFATDSKGQREQLISKLSDTHFVKSVYAEDGEPCFCKAGDVYLATERLKKLFAGVSGVSFVDDECKSLRGEKPREMLEACGAVRHLRTIDDSSLHPSSEEAARLRAAAGHADSTGYTDKISDSTLDGLDQLIELLPTISDEERRLRAEHLWDELAILEDRRGHGAFTGLYTWTDGGRYRTTFDAAFVRTLNETAWIPDADGEMQRPEFVLFEPLGWKPSPFLQSKIKFKPPIIDALAKEAGVEPGVLDLLKKHGLTSVADLVSRLGIDKEDEEDEADSEIDDEDDSEIEDEEGDDDDFEDDSDVDDDDEESDDEEDDSNAGDVDDAIKGLLGDAPGPTPPVDDPTGPEPPGGGGGKGSGKGGGSGTNGSGGGKGGKKGGKHSGKGKGGKGKAAGKQGGGAKPFISYVATSPDDEGPDPDGLNQDARMALEERAIELILAREPQLKRTPMNNPGFDLFEGSTEDGPPRKVEVKAMKGDFRSRPVGLSHTQFDCARREGRSYWLYVVDNAGDPEKARIIRIQDPAGRAKTYCFDYGWISVAEVDGPATDDDTEAEADGE